ncbi:MAG: hypothetical protein IKF54_04845 [Eubacterium sp.]|nr:hypothetical protein [Eubacterium sp.]
MGERLEKLFTLTDIENLDGAPVTIEAGGLIKDNKTGRVIARMYLKNCSDRPLNSVLVGFKPKGEGGRTISGMRDYLYNASGVPVGEIFGDQTGILFDNNETRSFSADVEEVDFEDGEYWDAAEAKRKAEELKLIVPEEKEREEVPEMWEKPVDKAAAPAVWESEEHSDEPHSADIYGAAIVKQKMEEPDDGDFMPASMETRQLQHEERPALEEQTDAYRQEQEKAVINLEGPAEEQPAIELGGPVVAEEQPEEGAEAIQEEPEITAEPIIKPAVEETEPAEEEIPEEAAEVEAEPEAAEESEQEAAAKEEEPEPAAAEEPAAEEEPETETAPEEESVEAGPVRLADMYGGAANASVLATYAAQYGRQFEQAEVIQPEPAIQAEPEPVEMPAEAAPEEVTEAEPEDLAPEVETAEEAAAETAVPEPEAPAVEPEAEPEPEEAAPAVEPEAEPEPEEAAPAVESEPQKTEESDQWAGYSAAYPSIFPGQKHEPESTAEPGVQEAAGTEPAAPEAETAEPQPEAAEQPNAEPEPATAEEHIPSIEDTIELPKAAAPEKGPEEAAQILSALENAAGNEAAEPKAAEAAALEADTEAPEASEPAAAAPETAQEAETTAPAAEAEAAPEAKTTAEAAETAEEVRPAQQQKADVVFAAENEVIPSIIDDSKEKALTGEDHSGRNLLNIIVFGGIALIILLVLLIKM